MLEGTLASFTLPDIFQLLSHTGKTGCLTLQRGADRGEVWLVGGQVRYATSTSGRHALGRRLVGAGMLEQEPLEAALRRQDELRRSGPGLRLGQILVEHGALLPADLEAVVREQIQDAVFDLMRWTEGTFRFRPADVGELEHETITLDLTVENLIMEGSRRLEEWSQVERFVPSTDAVVQLVVAADDEQVPVTLTRAEWRLVTFVDGTRTVGDLVALFGQGEFHTARILHGLAGAGLLRVGDPSSGWAPAVADLLRQQHLLDLLDGPADMLAAALAGGGASNDESPIAVPAVGPPATAGNDHDDLVHRLIAGVKGL